jgi:hypothetical protein
MKAVLSPLLLGLATVSALQQGPMLPSTGSNHGMERRNAIGCFLAGIVGSGLVLDVASASEDVVSPSLSSTTTGGNVIADTAIVAPQDGFSSEDDDVSATAKFSTYNVIPDASESLDPRLVEVNVSRTKHFYHTVSWGVPRFYLETAKH